MPKIIDTPFFSLTVADGLTAEQEAMIEKYWEVSLSIRETGWPVFAHKLNDLAKEYQTTAKKFENSVTSSSRVGIKLWTCKGCEKLYYAQNRSVLENYALQQKAFVFNGATFFCDECAKKEEALKAAQKEKEAAEKRSDVRKLFDKEFKPISPYTLTLRQMVYLVSVLQAGATENLQKIVPYDIWEAKLSPTNEYSLKAIEELLDSKIVRIHPDTDIDAFTKINIEAGSYSYYIAKVTLRPPKSSSDPDSPNAFIQEALKILASPWEDPAWADWAYDLWTEIALEECKEYLVHQLKEHQFEFNPGEKTKDYLTYALQSYSVAQVFSLIWSSVRDGAATYQRGNISRKQAANIAVAAIQSKTERYLANGWDPKPFGRNYELPESIMSRLFYSVVLRLGDNGIMQKINMDILEQRLTSDARQYLENKRNTTKDSFSQL